MFHEEDSDTELAFRCAIVRENIANTKVEIIPIVRIVDPLDSFQAEKVGMPNMSNETILELY